MEFAIEQNVTLDAKARKQFSARYYLCKDPGCRDAEPYDYRLLLSEFEQNWKKIREQSRLNVPSNITLDDMRIHTQSIRYNTFWNQALHRFFVPHNVGVRFHEKKNLLVCYSGSKAVCSVSGAASPNELLVFEDAVYYFLYNTIVNFIALPEKEKTVFLLKHFRITVLFAKKGRSWISRPDVWVLSESARFAQINALILRTANNVRYYDPFFDYSKLLLFMIQGVPLMEIIRKDTKETYCKLYADNGEFYSSLCFFAGFAGRAALLKRFYNANKGGGTTVCYGKELCYNPYLDAQTSISLKPLYSQSRLLPKYYWVTFKVNAAADWRKLDCIEVFSWKECFFDRFVQ